MRSNNMRGLTLAVVFGVALIPGLSLVAVAAEKPPAGRVEKVPFPDGATIAAIKGELKGDQYVDYQVRGGANQTLTVSLKPGNPQNYFNVNPPGTEISMFVGSMSGNQFKRVLAADGIYTIRVYLMRAAARRNESSRYVLSIALDGKALAPTPAAQDAVIRGTPFHASASTACARPGNPPASRCDAFVIRRGFDGTGTIEVIWPDGLKRSILFVKGRPLASDSRDTMTFARKADLTVVFIGSDERVEIPDALVTGG